MKKTMLFPLAIEIDDQTGSVIGFTDPSIREIEFDLQRIGLPVYNSLFEATAAILGRRTKIKDKYPMAAIIENKFDHANCLECAQAVAVGAKMRWKKNTGYWCLSCYDTK